MKNMKKRVIEGTITSKFGLRRDPINNTAKMHQGIDIAAPTGTPIYSPTAGYVSAIYSHPAGGLTIIVGSDCGQMRYGFCHLSGCVLGEGERVERGTMIARSGNSGRTTGAHLHYSVKQGGEWVNGKYEGGEFVDPSKYLDIE